MACSPTMYSLTVPHSFVFLAAMNPSLEVSMRVCSPDSASSLCSQVGYVLNRKIQSARPVQLPSLWYVTPPILIALVVRRRGIAIQLSCRSFVLFLPLVIATISLASLILLSTRLVPRPLSTHVLETVSGNVLGSRYNDSESTSSLHHSPWRFQD